MFNAWLDNDKPNLQCDIMTRRFSVENIFSLRMNQYAKLGRGNVVMNE